MPHARFLTIAAVALALGGATPAFACADNANCGPAASPIRALYDACSALPVLNPGNDTRVNFWLLSDDAQPFSLEPANGKPPYPPVDLWPVSFSYAVLRGAALPPPPANATPSPFAVGEGTRCVSEAKGRVDFVAAVEAAALPAQEKTALTALRRALGGKCALPGTAIDDKAPLRAQLKSDLGQAFLRYIGAATAFYDGAYDEAIATFEDLSKSSDPFLKDSAAYMVGRALLNKGQIGAFGVDDSDYEPKVKDVDSLKAAERTFDAYLKAHPAGRYAASARGLVRRIYWLQGDMDRLSEEYGRLASERSADVIARVNLTDEIEQKMIVAGADKTRDPILLAMFDLRRMRADGDRKLSAADLDAQEPLFSGHKPLFAYLKAARAFYVDNDFRKALELLGPPSSPVQSHLDFSREFLRGLALNAAGDAGAEAVWKGLIAGANRPWRRETAELGLAWQWERARTVNKVFMPDSPVRAEPIREILLRNIAGPIILRQQADDAGASPRERAVARFTLLYKEATHGLYAGFLKDYPALEAAPAGDVAFNNGMKLDAFRWQGQGAPYACPSLKTVMEKLAATPKNPQALLCLGEFLRTHSLDGFELDKPPEADQLGGQKPIFPGAPFARGDAYKALIADPATPDDARAYAYYRSIRCYEPSGINSCGGADVSKAVRKGWYDSLKARYGALPYVKSLRYYW